MYKKLLFLLSLGLLLIGVKYFNVNKREVPEMKQYKFPAENETHEGTWLTWPHHYTYGMEYRKEIEENRFCSRQIR